MPISVMAALKSALALGRFLLISDGDRLVSTLLPQPWEQRLG